MKITEYIGTLRENIDKARQQGKTVILIPTMGYLHEGHLAMVQDARKQDEEHEQNFIIMSIFVNPMQFGPTEDLEKYPRDLIGDTRLAQEAGVDMLFVPSVEEMYPGGKNLTTVSVSEITADLCGAKRPGHFQGVATVVNKLFNIVLPDAAYFGQKDFQQFAVIKKMVHDLNIPVQLIVFPTVREADGLALSSRNAYLNTTQRAQAPILYQALQEAKILIATGERSVDVIKDKITQRISCASEGKIDYVEIREIIDLKPIRKIEGSIVMALAVYFGSTRLIDNLIMEVD